MKGDSINYDMKKENDQPISDYLLNLSSVSRLYTNWTGSNRVK